MSKISTVLVFSIFLAGTTSSIAYCSEPPSPKELERMFLECESVLLVEFKRYEAPKNLSLSNPPIARYKPVEYLKGPPICTSLPIRYDFDVDPNQESNWKLKKSMMPQKGSKWILFIKSAVPCDGAFLTYEGAKGRLKYTEDNFEAVLKVLEKRKGSSATGEPNPRTTNRLLQLMYEKRIYDDREKLKDFLEGRSDSYSGVDARSPYIRKIHPMKAK